MSKRLEATNPFYVVLVVVGFAFAITACAYCVMAVRAVAPRTAEASASGQSLLQWIDQYGMWLMLGELLILGAATFGAITTEEYWNRRAQKRLETTQPTDER